MPVADRIDGNQVLVALQVLFGQCQFRFLLIELRLETVDARFVGLYLRLVDTGVDLGKQFAFSHRIADIDVDLLNLPGYLGADVDELLCLQLTLCRNNLLDSPLSNGYWTKGVSLRFFCADAY